MKIINLSVFLFFLHNLSAQCKIQGLIRDEMNNPIELATCFLLKDSVLIKEQISDSLGRFHFEEIDKGNYKFIIRYMNLEKKIDLQLFKDTNFTLTFSISNELEQVNISNKKPLVERKIDRMIFNVENSISAEGQTLYDLLKKTPGVRVQNSTVSITGKSAVNIYLDDRQIRLSNDELMTYLKSIQSNDISKIEVITTPPAKYDAEGNAGIINVITKSILKKGYSGMVFYSATRNSYFGNDGGINFNFNKKKISFNSSVSSGLMPFEKIETNFVNYPSSNWNNTSKYYVNYVPISTNFSIDYKINTKSKIGLSYQDMYGKVKDSGVSTLNVLTNSSLDSMIQSKIDTKIFLDIANANLYYDRNLDTNGKKMKLSFDWSKFKKIDNRSIQTEHFDNQSNLIENSRTNFSTNGLRNTNVFVSGLNFILPMKNFEMTTGLKSSCFISDVGFNYNDFSNLDTNISSLFSYKEFNNAAYVDVTKENEIWIFKAGLRAESTQVNTDSENKIITNNYNYIKLFPTVFLQKTIKENNIIGLNYSRRIARPTYFELNPFRFYENPYTYLVGNPMLRPSFSNNIEMNYSFKDNFNSSLIYSKITNGVGDVKNLDPLSKEQIRTFANCLNTEIIALNINYIFNKVSWWECSNTFNVFYTKNKSNLYYTLPIVKGMGGFIETNNQFTFNKEKTFAGEIFFLYSMPSIEGVSRVKQYFGLDFGLRYLLLDKKLKLALNVTDIFHSDLLRINTVSNNMNISERRYYDNRQVNFSISYNFGNSKIQKEEKEATNSEEQQRLK